jgi:multidrug efflux system outer membrane protein
MKRSYIIRGLAFFAAALLLQACFVAKDYSRPEVLSNNSSYRTDLVSRDSSSLANLSWRELFQDTILRGYIEKALENNTDIRIAIQQISIAQSYYLQGKAGYLPTLSAGARVNYQRLARNSQFGQFFNGSLTQYEVSALLSWEADIWGKIRSTKRAAQASYLQSVAAHQAVTTQLIAGIASSYFQLIALDEQLRIAEQTVKYRQASLETMRALKDAGNVTEVGVKQTEAQLYSAQALVVETTRNIRMLENRISILLGVEPGPIRRSTLDQQQLADVELSIGFPVQLLRRRPDVIASEYNLINSFELTNVARSNFYPSLTITSATGGLQSLDLDQLFSVNSLFATVVGGLTQPILNGRRIRTQYEVAQSQQEIAYLNFRQSILNATREVSDALYSYEAAGERIDLKSQELAAYDTAVVFSEELLNSGLINYLEVITARQNTLNSQLDLINARFNQLNAVVDLYRALGGGWE